MPGSPLFVPTADPGKVFHLPPWSNSACVEGLHLHRCSIGTPDSCREWCMRGCMSAHTFNTLQRVQHFSRHSTLSCIQLGGALSQRAHRAVDMTAAASPRWLAAGRAGLLVAHCTRGRKAEG